MENWTGIIPPVVTPFDEDGSIDFKSYQSVVSYLVDNGVNGLFTLGSTGEVAYISDDDRRRLIELTVEMAGNLPVFAGCIDLTARRCIEQARVAEDCGVSAVVVTAPIYARNDLAEIAEHFRMIAASISIPVIAYDIPVRVHTKLPPDFLVALGAEGTVSGVKDSSGDDVNFRRLLRLNKSAGSPLRVFTGHEAVVDGMMLMGTHGVVPGLANVDPAGYARLWECGKTGRWGEAMAEQERLAALFEMVFVSPELSPDAAGVGAFKEALFQLGVIKCPKMALPTRGLSTEAASKVRHLLTEAGLLSD